MKGKTLNMKEMDLSNDSLQNNSFSQEFDSNIIPNVCFYQNSKDPDSKVFIFVLTSSLKIYQIVVKPVKIFNF